MKSQNITKENPDSLTGQIKKNRELIITMRTATEKYLENFKPTIATNPNDGREYNLKPLFDLFGVELNSHKKYLGKLSNIIQLMPRLIDKQPEFYKQVTDATDDLKRLEKAISNMEIK